MDLYHQYGTDLIAGANGDLLTVTGDTEVQQRLLRRLFTPYGGYLWNLTFGANVPGRVGDTLSPSDFGKVLADVKSAVAQESGVAKNPAPVVDLSLVDNGLVGTITYLDAQTKVPVVISFPVAVA